MTFIHMYLQLTMCKLRVSRTNWPPDVYRPAFAVLGAVRKRTFHLHGMSCGNEEYSISRLSKLLYDIVYQNGLLSCTDLILDNATRMGNMATSNANFSYLMKALDTGYIAL